MSEAKHTPGPWHVSNGVHGQHSVCGNTQWAMAGSGTVAPCVAVVHGRGSDAEAAANARLIAEAPALLAVAQALVAWDDAQERAEELPPLALIESAREALRKAGA